MMLEKFARKVDGQNNSSEYVLATVNSSEGTLILVNIGYAEKTGNGTAEQI